VSSLLITTLAQALILEIFPKAVHVDFSCEPIDTLYRATPRGCGAGASRKSAEN
jgi:hypothetical protein